MERLVMYIINQYNLDLTNLDDLKILGEKVRIIFLMDLEQFTKI